MKKIILLTIVAISIAVACKKAETDSSNPVITISSPTQGQAFNAADSVTIAFTGTDDDFHGYDFTLTNNTTSAAVDQDDQHTHGNISISKKYKLPAASSFTLEVNAEDHNGNESTKSVNFTTN